MKSEALTKYKYGVPIKAEGRDYLKEIVRIRDNHTCQECGIKWWKGQRKFDVHRISNDDNGGYYPVSDIDNWITYCHLCHLNLLAHRKKISEAMYKRLKEVEEARQFCLSPA